MDIGVLRAQQSNRPITAINPLNEIIMSGLNAYQQGANAFLAPQMAKANLGLTEAKAKREEAMSQLPFGGANVPGPAGEIVGLEMIRQMYGDNSPQYKKASESFSLSQQSTGSRLRYQDALTNSMGMRYMTPEGKQIVENSNVNQGFSPSGTPQGVPVAPGQAPYIAPSRQNTTSEGAHYGLRQIKQDLPAFVMQKNLFANNIDKTIDNIDLNALTQYNGPFGALELKKEEAADINGKASQKYQKYKEAEKKFNFLSTQVRQFYGDSIQPSAMQELQEKLDPRGAFKSVETGKRGFDSQKDLLRKELQTYRDASKDASSYYGNNKNTNNTSNIQVNLKGFKNKQEFQNWYNQQPPEIKEAARAQLQGAM